MSQKKATKKSSSKKAAKKVVKKSASKKVTKKVVRSKKMDRGDVVKEHAGPMIEVVLRCDLEPNAQEVSVAGDFSEWLPLPMAADPSNPRVFEISLKLARGHYQYKYLIDGEWRHDPNSPELSWNQYGTQNSILVVV